MHYYIGHLRQWFLLLTALLPSLWATAQFASDSTAQMQNELTVDLQFYARGESRYGGIPASEDEDSESQSVGKSNFIQGRARLPINYKRDWLEARITPQHSGVWGQEGKGSFNLYESWAKLTARCGLFAQVGRVALSYDDERIIGSDNWAMASQSHDVLRLGYEGHGHKAHAILAYNQNAKVLGTSSSYYVNGAQPYKTMQVLWYHYDLPRLPLGASLLFMNIGMQNSDNASTMGTKFQQLLGSHLKFAPPHWKAEASYYHQLGQNEDGMRINAWMASAKVSFSPANYGFTLGYDYMSGDKYFAVPPQGAIGMARHEVIRGFSTVYGSHHKFYGAMDFFYVTTYVNGFTPGLQKAYLQAFYKPIPNLSLNAGYHYLATATKLEDIDRPLGNEFEIQASYSISRDVTVSIGGSLMKGTETMEKLKRSNNNNMLRWGWLSLSVNPRVFSFRF